MISLQNHFINSTHYNDAWRDRPAELVAYMAYRGTELEHVMRRQFPRLFSIEGRMQPVVDELVRAGVLRSSTPWEYAPATLPKSEAQFELMMRDRRWANVPVVSSRDAVHMLKVITGHYLRSGYRAYPKTFAQTMRWDTTDNDTDERMCRMMWAEEDWMSDLLLDVEILYYQFVRGTAAEETL